MSRSAGPGSPLTFYCTMCRRMGRHRYTNQRKIVRTGRTRPKRNGAMGVRSLNTEHEYRCRRCGHLGWSCHTDIVDFPLREK
jgi:hypothetical protein